MKIITSSFKIFCIFLFFLLRPIPAKVISPGEPFFYQMFLIGAKVILLCQTFHKFTLGTNVTKRSFKDAVRHKYLKVRHLVGIINLFAKGLHKIIILSILKLKLKEPDNPVFFTYYDSYHNE